MGKNLSRQEIIKQASILVEPVLVDMGYELVEVEYMKEFGDYFLKIFIYNDTGVGVDDCEIIARKVSEILDEKDLIPGAYYLEVSSPGLDRPISTNDDLRRNLNKDIEVRLYKAIDNIKNFEGKLIDYNEEDIKIVEEDETERVIPRQSISLMRLVIKI
ncbi:MAG TPA: ribosome maturation factor RimP [Tissierellaceae bacterium]